MDAPHSVRRGGSALYYYARDPQGNVRGLITASSGALAAKYTYGAFGDATVEGSAPNTLRFAARDHDATTGLYYNRARYYDPKLGRFISEDPIGLDGGINLYTYAGNDPINFRDPFGLADDCVDIIGWIEDPPDGRVEVGPAKPGAVVHSGDWGKVGESCMPGESGGGDSGSGRPEQGGDEGGGGGGPGSPPSEPPPRRPPSKMDRALACKSELAGLTITATADLSVLAGVGLSAYP